MVVSNSSVLIALSAIKQLHLLQKMFNRVMVPDAVWQEVVVEGEGEPGALVVKEASWIETRKIKNTLLSHALQESLDQGEAEAIVLSIEQQLDTILLDEKPARERAAYFGLRPLGTLGVLIWATREQYIPELKPVLDQLVKEGDFRLSSTLYNKALTEVGE